MRAVASTAAAQRTAAVDLNPDISQTSRLSGLVTCVTALAKSFKFRQDRTLRHLLAVWIFGSSGYPFAPTDIRGASAVCVCSMRSISFREKDLNVQTWSKSRDAAFYFSTCAPLPLLPGTSIEKQSFEFEVWFRVLGRGDVRRRPELFIHQVYNHRVVAGKLPRLRLRTLTFRPNTATEAIDQFVAHRLWTFDGCGRDFRIGASVQVAHFLDTEVRVRIGQTNSVVG